MISQFFHRVDHDLVDSCEDNVMRRVNSTTFPVLKGISMQSIRLHPGAAREPHVHPDAHQLDYCAQGQARVGIVGPDGSKEEIELEAGDCVFIPQGYMHWIECAGDTPCHCLLILSNEAASTIAFGSMAEAVAEMQSEIAV